MRAAKILATFSFLVVIAACGTGGPTPTPTATQDLEARAVAAYSFAPDRDWIAQAEYVSSRSSDICDASDYAARVANFAELIIGMDGAHENAKIDFVVDVVTVDGTEGSVSITYLLNGEPPLVSNQRSRRWVLQDNQWWEEHEAWQDGCVGWKLFE